MDLSLIHICTEGEQVSIAGQVGINNTFRLWQKSFLRCTKKCLVITAPVSYTHLIAINPARIGSINPNAVLPIPLNRAATGVMVPKFAL